MKVVHVIVGLNVGGAELMLLRLIGNMNSNYKNVVISLTDLGKLGEQYKEEGIEVLTLGAQSFFDFPSIFLDLRRLLKQLRPDVVQTWMYHSDFLGGLAARSVGIKNVVWNVRNTKLGGRGFGNYWFRRLCGLFSYIVPRTVLFVSDSAKLAHERKGYCPRKSQVIYNGFDLERFRFDQAAKNKVRESLGLTKNEFLICSVGRFVPEKDHLTFIMAVRSLVDSGADVSALMIGHGVDWDNTTIVDHIRGVEKYFHLLGPQKEVQDFLSCADVFCLHSTTEGFPNVLGEAMAVGLPCITTRAGDAERILNSPEFTVNAGDCEGLVEALTRVHELSDEERKSLGAVNRHRVERQFSLSGTVAQFEELYSSLKG